MELDSLYQEVILDHYRSPLNKGLSTQKDIQVHHNNPSCGDEVTLNLTMQNGIVKEITWDGVGCSISMASASVMSDLLSGKEYLQALKILQAFVDLMQSKGQSKGDEEMLEDGVAFAGVSKFPARIKCALLGWMAFKDAATQVMAQNKNMGATIDDITEAMKDVIDPELGINVVDLGLVYDMRLDENNIATLDMTLTSAACPLQDIIEEQTRQVLADLTSDVKINWVWLPPWGPNKISDDGREQLRSIGFTV